MPVKPYIVAEVSANHAGSFDRCLRIIDAAKYAGADAVKLQTYNPDTMVADRTYVIPDGPWAGQRLWDLYNQAMTPLVWHADLFDYCKVIGITCFSTPFDETAVDFLERLDCPMYKIASFELTDLPLLRKVAKTGKPMILSTGMAAKDEIQEAVYTIRTTSESHITLLKCTSAYPAKPEDANLATLPDMAREMMVDVGVSDHTLGLAVPIASVVLGGTFIEKHLTLDDLPTLDSAFSLKPDEFRMMVAAVRNAAKAVGTVQYGKQASESSSYAFRRSVYAVADIRKGEALTENNVKTRRPALGAPAKHYPELLKRTAAIDIKAGMPITWDSVE